MKLRNIKASFILEEKFTTNQRGINYIFKHLGFTFTIYNHSLYLVNVTGIKSFDHLKLAREIIELEIKIREFEMGKLNSQTRQITLASYFI